MLSMIVNGSVCKESMYEWNDFPEPIDRMEYKISPTKCIVFEGFEKYIRIKENVTGVNIKLNKVAKVILMGQSFGSVAIISLDLKTGELAQQERKLGFEYENKPINPLLWKKGIGGQAKIYTREEVD